MATRSTDSTQLIRPKGYFATTHWSVVLTAGRADTAHSREALEQLCRNYWMPLYAYVRRSGHSPHDAQDLTQEFFAHLLRREIFAKAAPGRGQSDRTLVPAAAPPYRPTRPRASARGAFWRQA